MIYKKIQNCRNAIKKQKLEKKGWNDYSKYKYYLPEQVDKLVHDACVTENLFCKFDLIRNVDGLHGELTIINLDKPDESDVWKAATEMPIIKATNVSQQMGGCMTFTERYLKQTAFDIVDNNQDFDSKKPDGGDGKPEKEWLNFDSKDYPLVLKAVKQKLRTIDDVRKTYKVSKQMEEKLLKG